MRFTELIVELIKSKSGFSSKRFAALLLILSSVLIPVICMLISDPIGSVDESILILSAQLLMSACGLLGFTLKEPPIRRSSSRSKKSTNNEVNK